MVRATCPRAVSTGSTSPTQTRPPAGRLAAPRCPGRRRPPPRRASAGTPGPEPRPRAAGRPAAEVARIGAAAVAGGGAGGLVSAWRVVGLGRGLSGPGPESPGAGAGSPGPGPPGPRGVPAGPRQTRRATGRTRLPASTTRPMPSAMAPATAPVASLIAWTASEMAPLTTSAATSKKPYTLDAKSLTAVPAVTKAGMPRASPSPVRKEPMPSRPALSTSPTPRIAPLRSRDARLLAKLSRASPNLVRLSPAPAINWPVPPPTLVPASRSACPMPWSALPPPRSPPTTAAPGRATAPSPGGEGAGGRRPRPRSLSTAAGDSVDRRLRTSGTLMSATPTRRWTPPRLNLMTRSRSGTERSTCTQGDARFGVDDRGEGRVQRHLGDHVAEHCVRTRHQPFPACCGPAWSIWPRSVACVVRLAARPPPNTARHAAPATPTPRTPGGPPTPRHAAKPRRLDAPTS